MTWLPLSLLAAFFLATADAVTKRYLSAYRPGEIAVVRFGGTGLLLLPLLFLQPWPPLPAPFWGLLAIALPLEITAMWLYMKAISTSPLSLTLPYLAFTPVFNILTGYLILGETVSRTGLTGILMVVAGAWLLNLKEMNHHGTHHPLAPFRAIVRVEGARLMLITAAIYSVNSVLGKALLGYAPPLFFGPFYFLAVGSAAALLFSLRRPDRWRAVRQHPLACLLVGFFMAGMILAHFHAVTMIEVAYMIAVKRTSLLFGMLYGAWLFKEKGLALHLAAGAIMIGGVLLIAA